MAFYPGLDTPLHRGSIHSLTGTILLENGFQVIGRWIGSASSFSSSSGFILGKEQKGANAGEASLGPLVSGGLGEGVYWGRIKAYGQSCPGLPGLVVTSLPSPSPANKSPVCLFVTMETPALPPCRAPGPVLCSSESCSLTLQGMAL